MYSDGVGWKNRRGGGAHSREKERSFALVTCVYVADCGCEHLGLRVSILGIERRSGLKLLRSILIIQIMSNLFIIEEI